MTAIARSQPSTNAIPRRLPEGIVSSTMIVTTDTGLQTAIASPSPKTVGISDCTAAISTSADGSTSSETGDALCAKYGAARTGDEAGLEEQRHGDALGDGPAVEALDRQSLGAATLDESD